jgi:hypothetical protein
MTDVDLGRLVRDARVNAILAWAVVAALAATALGNVLSAHYLWGGFATAVVVIVLLPAVLRRNPRAMLPWEVLVVAGLPVLGRSVVPLPAGGDVGTYLSVAALALIVAVELQVFTPVRMTPTFAVVFVVVTTLAVAGVWAIVRWTADVWFGTTFLLDPALTETAVERALMLEFVASAAAGLVAGVVFEFYVRRRATVHDRLGPEAAR